MKKNKVKYFLFIAALIICSSCIKDDVTNIDSDIQLQPEYAIPFGFSAFKLNDFIDDSISQFPIDTTLISDTENLVQFNDVFFYFPPTVSFDLFTPLSLSSIEGNTDQIISAMFRMNARNGIPATIKIQVYFLGASNLVLDSLYSEGAISIEAAKTDDNGEVIDVGILVKEDTYLDQETIDNLVNTNTIKINANLFLADSSPVVIKFYSDQVLEVQLGAKVKLDISTNEE